MSEQVGGLRPTDVGYQIVLFGADGGQVAAGRLSSVITREGYSRSRRAEQVHISIETELGSLSMQVPLATVCNVNRKDDRG